MGAVPYSTSELLEIARSGSGQDVIDALESMAKTHGPGITSLMLHCAAQALEADRFFSITDWDRHTSPAMHWTSNDLEGAAHP